MLPLVMTDSISAFIQACQAVRSISTPVWCDDWVRQIGEQQYELCVVVSTLARLDFYPPSVPSQPASIILACIVLAGRLYFPHERDHFADRQARQAAADAKANLADALAQLNIPMQAGRLIQNPEVL